MAIVECNTPSGTTRWAQKQEGPHLQEVPVLSEQQESKDGLFQGGLLE